MLDGVQYHCEWAHTFSHDVCKTNLGETIDEQRREGREVRERGEDEEK